jgi:hypothetical protein
MLPPHSRSRDFGNRASRSEGVASTRAETPAAGGRRMCSTAYAIVEPLISELQNGSFAHAPSGNFQAHAGRARPSTSFAPAGPLFFPFHRRPAGEALAVRPVLLEPTVAALRSPAAGCSGAGRPSGGTREAEHPQRWSHRSAAFAGLAETAITCRSSRRSAGHWPSGSLIRSPDPD